MCGEALRFLEREWRRVAEREDPLSLLAKRVRELVHAGAKPVDVQLPSLLAYESGGITVELLPSTEEGRCILRVDAGGDRFAVPLSRPPRAAEVLALSVALTDPSLRRALEPVLRGAGLGALYDRAVRGALELSARLPERELERMRAAFRYLWWSPIDAARVLPDGAGRRWIVGEKGAETILGGAWVELRGMGAAAAGIAEALAGYAAAVKAALEAITSE